MHINRRGAMVSVPAVNPLRGEEGEARTAEPRAKQHRRVCWLGADPRRDGGLSSTAQGH
jgi:hypothetical protein